MLTSNVRRTVPDGEGWRRIRCKCSSLKIKGRYVAEESKDKVEQLTRLEIVCGNCGKVLLVHKVDE